MSEKSAIDDDPVLADLINKLNGDTAADIDDIEAEEESSKVSEPEAEDIPEPQLSIVPDPEPEPTEVEPDPDLAEELESMVESESSEDDSNVNLNQTYDDIVQEVRDNYAQDREQIENFRAMLAGKIQNGDDSRILYESLSAVLRTKAETAATMVRLLDNISKRMDKGNSGALDLGDLLLDE